MANKCNVQYLSSKVNLNILFLACFSLVIINFLIASSTKKYSPSYKYSQDDVSNAVLQKHSRCRAMFTLSDVYQKQWTPPHLQEDPTWYLTAEALHNVTKKIDEMMKMRDEGVGPSTQDYRDLGRFVPNLFNFTPPPSYVQDSHSGSDSHSFSRTHNSMFQSTIKVSSNTNKQDYFGAQHPEREDSGSRDSHKSLPGGKVISYLRSSRGMFPFIPCRIKQQTKDDVLHCLEKRMQQKEGVTIFFLGDSKVRNIFSTFLNVTSYLKYNVSYANKTETLETLLKEYSSKEFKHEDVDAISSTYPNFRVITRFRRFWDMANLHTSREVMLLKDWASGRRPVPDLLIVGYTTWLLTLHITRKDYKTNVSLDMVHLLFDLHKVIVPLLKEVSLKTKVLVHADTRVRPFTKSLRKRDLWQSNVMFHDSLMDWSEMIFWYFMQNDKDHHKETDHWQILTYLSSKVLHDFLSGSNSPKFPQSYITSMNRVNHLASKNSFVNSKMGYDRTSRGIDPGDYLRHAGLWWWDTTLVLNLATISECGKLYELNLENHPLYNSKELWCNNRNHAGNSTNEVEVHMIVSLLCNSVVTTGEEYCCS